MNILKPGDPNWGRVIISDDNKNFYNRLFNMNGINKELEAIKDNQRDCITKYKIIKAFVEKYPNDALLGEKIRAYMLKMELKRRRLNDKK